MTDGSSQGLFVVVAVVIFGIFVAISYSLFRETLTPSLASIFSSSTGQASQKVIGKNIPLKMRDLGTYTYSGMEGLEIIHRDDTSIVYTSVIGTIHAGISIPKELFNIDGKYIVSYDITLLEGDIYRLGGHLSVTSYQKVRVNDEKIEGDYYKGVTYSLKKGEKYHVEVEFKKNDKGIDSRTPFYIQPNREGIETGNEIYKTGYKAKIENVVVTELY